MPTLLLVAFVICEAAFAIASLKGKAIGRKWLKMRIIVSIAEFALAMVAMLASQASPGMRFSALLAVMGLRIVAEGILYLAKRNAPQSEAPLKRNRAVRSAVRGSIIVAFALVPAFLFTGYAGLPASGAHDVEQASAILVDQARTDPFETDGSAREVPIHVFYPADAGEGASDAPYPLVVFSHGAFGYYNSNYSTYAELASHGYVVAALDYPHHAFVTHDTDGQTIIADTEFLQTAMAAESDELSEEETFIVTHEWLDLRMADLNFVLDTLEETEAANALDPSIWRFANDDEAEAMEKALSRADLDRIGLAGHSLGGATSVEAGRTRDDIDAVIDIDGTMFGSETAFENGKTTFNTDPYPIPLLSIDNAGHYRVGQELGSDYVNNVVLDNAIDSKHTYFVGSGHLNFTDLPLFSPALASLLGTGTVDAQACIEQMNAIVLQFFDYHLKGIGEVDSIADSYDPGD